MSEMTLLDYRGEVTDVNRVPKWIIKSKKELETRLKSLKSADAGVFILKSNDKKKLRIGLGAEFGFLYWFDDDARFAGPAITDTRHTDEDDYFLFEGMQEEISSEELFPVDDVIRGAVSFFTTREIPKGFKWKLWDPKSNAWQSIQT